MKLAISQLNDGENAYSFSSSKDAWIQEFTNRLSSKGYQLPGGFDAQVTVTKLEPDYFIRGKMGFVVSQCCARCAENFEGRLNPSFDLAFTHLTHRNAPETGELSDADLEAADTQPLRGNEIDLDPILEEQFFLSLPFAPLCKPDCKGVCQSCGKNFNQGSCSCESSDKTSPFAVLKELHLESEPEIPRRKSGGT